MRSKMMKAIGYIRVSTEEQAKEGISLDNQEAKIKAYCESQDWELVKVFSDEGLSGKDVFAFWLSGQSYKQPPHPRGQFLKRKEGF